MILTIHVHEDDYPEALRAICEINDRRKNGNSKTASSKPTGNNWKPEEGQLYYHWLEDLLRVAEWRNEPLDVARWLTSNCFKTKTEAYLSRKVVEQTVTSATE